ncbi:MAG: tetratricopeptide repeat protein [Elusimicrobia bacterium]|nr:tetratricopeptide repeat protein [Elusimicrobiota bacterium]
MSLLAAALLLAWPSPAGAASKGQLERQTKNERSDYDRALKDFQKKQKAADKAGAKLDDLRDAKAGGATKDSVGGDDCRIDSCIKKEERILASKEKAEDAALAKARKEAQDYIDQENTYAAANGGRHMDAALLASARSFLASPPSRSGPGDDPGSENATDGPCLDRFGVPCIPPGTDNPLTTGGGSPGGPVPAPEFQADAAGAAAARDGALGTGHEADDLSRFAASRASAYESGGISVGGGGGRGGVTLDPRYFGTTGEKMHADLRLMMQRRAYAEANEAVARLRKSGQNPYETEAADAELKNAEGDWAAAEAAAKKAIALNPSDPRAHKALAVSLLHQGRNDEALKAAEAAAELDPSDAETQLLRAFAFEGLGRKEEMMQAVTRAARLDSRFLPYLELARKGRVLFDRRRSAKGWHGFPIPDLADPAYADAPAGGVPKPALVGGALLGAAGAIMGFAAWKKRRDPRRVVI